MHAKSISHLELSHRHILAPNQESTNSAGTGTKIQLTGFGYSFGYRKKNYTLLSQSSVRNNVTSNQLYSCTLCHQKGYKASLKTTWRHLRRPICGQSGYFSTSLSQDSLHLMARQQMNSMKIFPRASSSFKGENGTTILRQRISSIIYSSSMHWKGSMRMRQSIITFSIHASTSPNLNRFHHSYQIPSKKQSLCRTWNFSRGKLSSRIPYKPIAHSWLLKNRLSRPSIPFSVHPNL